MRLWFDWWVSTPVLTNTSTPPHLPPSTALLDLLPPLPARYYSVASSPLLDPNAYVSFIESMEGGAE